MNLVDQIEAKEMKKEVADVNIGDTVKVHMRIVEGEKERVQVIEGVVIKMRGSGVRKTLTVRKIFLIHINFHNETQLAGHKLSLYISVTHKPHLQMRNNGEEK